MNYKKGFTLVEILIVIAIIGLLIAIAVPSIMSLSKKMKERGFDSKIESIEQAAVNFVQDNANKIKDKYNGTDKFVCNEEGKDCKYKFTISVQDLVDQGVYKSENKNSCDVTNPYDGSECLDCALINIELDDEYKTVTARVVRPDDDKYLVKDKTCPASFNYELEYVDFTVTAENKSWVGFTGKENENLVIPATFTKDGIRYKVTSIGSSAFDHCDSLISVTIPLSVTSIGQSPFGISHMLSSINVDSKNPNYKSIDGVLFTKDGTLLIQYPIGKNSTSYNIPNGVTEIGYEAFISCSSLTSVTIPSSVNIIGQEAFEFCHSLNSINIPTSVTTIELRAFSCCYGITSITIPSSVTRIGSEAFSNCDLSSIMIPSSVTHIGEGVFASQVTDKLSSIDVDSNNPNYKSVDGVLYTKNGTTLVQYPRGKKDNQYNIPNGVTRIGAGAFDGCSDYLTSVNIPDSVTSIGQMAFYGCEKLTTVTIPNSVTKIEYRTFSYCKSLSSLMYKGSTYTSESAFENAFLPNTIGDYAFTGTELSA